jgi:NCAIR mutase (PurE)-related protein
MDKFYFNFFDIPDLIVKMKYTRKEYDMIIKVLLKVKKSYLETKMEKEIMERMQENLLKIQSKNHMN